MLGDTQDVGEKVAPFWAVESLLFTGLAEGLARTACAKDIVLGNRLDVDAPDIRCRLDVEVFLVDAPQYLIDFAGEYALVPKTVEAEVESAEPSEYVNESHGAPGVLLALPPRGWR